MADNGDDIDLYGDDFGDEQLGEQTSIPVGQGSREPGVGEKRHRDDENMANIPEEHVRYCFFALACNRSNNITCRIFPPTWANPLG